MISYISIDVTKGMSTTKKVHIKIHSGKLLILITVLCGISNKVDHTCRTQGLHLLSDEALYNKIPRYFDATILVVNSTASPWMIWHGWLYFRQLRNFERTNDTMLYRFVNKRLMARCHIWLLLNLIVITQIVSAFLVVCKMWINLESLWHAEYITSEHISHCGIILFGRDLRILEFQLNVRGLLERES